MNRNGNRWTINELLSLQREYELLEWSIQDIAVKHQRTERAILFRLESEGIITSWNNARGFDMESYKASFEDNNNSESYVFNGKSCLDDEEDEDCEQEICDNVGGTNDVDKLTERIWSLETAVTDINNIVQQLFNIMISSNKNKLDSLPKQQVVEH